MLLTDPIDLLLDNNNDLVIESGDLQFSKGVQAIMQQCRIQLQMFQGEWFLDLDAGIPYWQSILGSKTSDAIAAARIYFTGELLNVQGVTEVTKMELSYKGTDRSLTIKWRVTTVFGETPDDIISLRVTTGGV